MDRLPKTNLTAKIVALVLAVILWVYVMNEQNPPVEVNMEVPLEIRNTSISLVPVDIPEFVRIRVRGPRTLIAGLSQQDIKTYIDLRGLTEGLNTAKVHTTVPTSMEVVEVIPDRVTFRLDHVANRQVPVDVRLVGSPSIDTVVEKINYSTAHVVVEGPKGLLDTVSKAVATVDVSGKNADFTVSAPLILLDQNGKEIGEGLSFNPGNVSVSLSFAPSVSKRVIDIKPSVTGELPKGYIIKQLVTNPPRVEVSGTPNVVEKTDFIYTEPINLDGIDKEREFEVKLVGKEGIVIPKKSIKVNISVIKQQ